MMSCLRVYNWWVSKYILIFTSLVRSGIRYKLLQTLKTTNQLVKIFLHLWSCFQLTANIYFWTLVVFTLRVDR